MDSMQNENENSDIIELLEKSLKSSKKKIRTAYMGADLFVNALPKRLVDSLVCEVKKEGREAVRQLCQYRGSDDSAVLGRRYGQGEGD